eukprot:m.29376 g.29376  ORF g.29376 m.29376 type:complete len:427 (+) comp6147_c0_seq1:21-1301(+)
MDKKVLFLHPDLGIGGAERLVVDAALALKKRGYKVCIATSHHDKERCFEETRNGEIEVVVHGDWLPRTLFGRFYAFCAYLRMFYLAILVLLLRRNQSFVFIDQISACIPIVRLMTRAKILFYCHFPDQLLTKRESFWKSLYRKPIDFLEEKTTGMADVLMVNSKFTKKVYYKTFTTLAETDPFVVYPSLNFDAFDRLSYDEEDADVLVGSSRPLVFLSINRYERKKNLLLAIQALATLKESLISQSKAKLWENIHLVIAGGYDTRLTENVEYYEELSQAASTFVVGDNVTFLRSFSDRDKVLLLRRSSCLIYTPENEHFGITPLEAMYMRRPVIAINSGGPMETVSSYLPPPVTENSSLKDRTKATETESTGFLCESSPEAMAKAMELMAVHENIRNALVENCRKHVEDRFSFEAFTNNLVACLKH